MSNDDLETMAVLSNWTLTAGEFAALERVRDRLGVEISLVMVNDESGPDSESNETAAALDGRIGREYIRLASDVLRRERGWAAVVAERELAEKFGASYPLLERAPVATAPIFDDVEMQWVSPITDGNWNELPPSAVDTLATRADVAVRFGFGLVRGAVLDAPAHGVVSFHPANVRRYRGMGPPQVFLDGRRRIGVTLQRLAPDIDAGEIVTEGTTDIRECQTVWDVFERVEACKIELLTDGIAALRNPAFETTVPDSFGQYYPTARKQSFKFASRIVAKNVRGRLAGRFRNRLIPSRSPPPTQPDTDSIHVRSSSRQSK